MPTKERLSLAQLRAEQCFLDLTPRQKKMIEVFVESDGDKVLAVTTAYTPKSAEVARVMSYELFESPKVIACLTAYFQDDPMDVFKRAVRRAMTRKRLTVAQVTAMKLYCDLNGWGSKSLPNTHGHDSAEPTADSETPRPALDSRVPPGATPLVDGSGVVRGYRTLDGRYVRLADVEVVR